MFLSSHINTSGSLIEREMLWVRDIGGVPNKVAKYRNTSIGRVEIRNVIPKPLPCMSSLEQITREQQIGICNFRFRGQNKQIKTKNIHWRVG